MKYRFIIEEPKMKDAFSRFFASTVWLGTVLFMAYLIGLFVWGIISIYSFVESYRIIFALLLLVVEGILVRILFRYGSKEFILKKDTVGSIMIDEESGFFHYYRKDEPSIDFHLSKVFDYRLYAQGVGEYTRQYDLHLFLNSAEKNLIIKNLIASKSIEQTLSSVVEKWKVSVL